MKFLKRRQRLLLFLIFSYAAVAQQEHSKTDARFEFLPAGLHFAPLKANPQEARIGLFKYFGSSNLKVDIGNTIDIFGFSSGSSRVRWTVGIDFMAYAFVTGSQGLRLQVDALNGFFGGNVAFSQTFGSNPDGSGGNRIQSRFRFLHLSAHMVDGHYNLSTKQWLNNREPIPFTKDFGELTIAHELQSSAASFRYYGGASYATLVRPVELKHYAFLAGFELAAGKLFARLFERPSSLFIADHFTISGNPVYQGSNQTQLGIKFGDWDGKGVVFYLAYYRGNNFFSEYFDERVNIVGAGFTVDFP